VRHLVLHRCKDLTLLLGRLTQAMDGQSRFPLGRRGGQGTSVCLVDSVSKKHLALCWQARAASEKGAIQATTPPWAAQPVHRTKGLNPAQQMLAKPGAASYIL